MDISELIIATVNNNDLNDLRGELTLDTSFNCVWKANIATSLWK